MKTWADQNPEAQARLDAMIAGFRAAAKSPTPAKVEDPVDGLLRALGTDRETLNALATSK